MVKFEALRASLVGVLAAAPSMVDDERAQRIAHAVAMATGRLDALEGANTTERLANRSPAARRVLERLSGELAPEGAAGWAELVAPVRAQIARTCEALAIVEATAKEADQRIAAALRTAVAA